MVIAGDNRAGNGEPTRAFDNARRTIADRLQNLGFPRRDTVQLSVDPDIYPDAPAGRVSLARFRRELARLKNRTADGCLFYFTSHGLPEGLILGEKTIAADAIWSVINDFCGTQPIIMVVSACYSGQFADKRWHRNNRYIFTAARRDRSSFGCGTDDIYPYFDGCVIDALNSARDWIGLAGQVKQCVSRREIFEGAKPPSEPQLSIGTTIRALLEAKPFTRRIETVSKVTSPVEHRGRSLSEMP